MIAASEPLEVIPWGCRAVKEHPGSLAPKNDNSQQLDTILQERLQNIDISGKNDLKEFWITGNFQTLNRSFTDQCSPMSTRESEFQIENELYAKGLTAVWSSGLLKDDCINSSISFTCETPIKHIAFCPRTFMTPSEYGTKDSEKESKEGICLIDSSTMKVYCSDGEEYTNSLNFPVAKILFTKFGMLIEKEASKTRIDHHQIPMPRLFSLAHPLDEMCPIIVNPNGIPGYVIESYFKIVYSTSADDIILIYDSKHSVHMVCKIRKATDEEINAISGNDSTMDNGHLSSTGFNFSNNVSGRNQKPIPSSNRSSITPLTNVTKHACQSFNNSANSLLLSLKSINQSPYVRLESGCTQLNVTQQPLGFEQTPSSKPLPPEYCLDVVWTEQQDFNIEYSEPASKGFMHKDLKNDIFLCYLLCRNMKLIFLSILKQNDKDTFKFVGSIAAKDVVVLENIGMIAVLAPCGTVILYSGTSMVGKVHVHGKMSCFTTSENLSSALTTAFPRRSSLLPTVSNAMDATFDDEFHLLSPVQPLPGTATKYNSYCSELRDVLGNSVSLVYPGGKMFRITLPSLSDNTLVKKCLHAIYKSLNIKTGAEFLIKWYGFRNVPGSHSLSITQEWDIFRKMVVDFFGRPIQLKEYSQEIGVNVLGELPKKRRKNPADSGSDADWDFMKNYIDSNETTVSATEKIVAPQSINKNAFLFKETAQVFVSLHLQYEDFKLDENLCHYMSQLGELLFRLAEGFSLQHYMTHYIYDFPEFIRLLNDDPVVRIEFADVSSTINNITGNHVPHIFETINKIVLLDTVHSYLFLEDVNNKSVDLIKIISLIVKHPMMFDEMVRPFNGASILKIDKNSWDSHEIAKVLLTMGFTRSSLNRLPPALHYILSQFLEGIRINPPLDGSPELYQLILRADLEAHHCLSRSIKPKNNYNVTNDNVRKEHSLSSRLPTSPDIIPKVDAVCEDDDGMEHVDTKLLRLRFPKDLRLFEIRRMLNSSIPIVIDMVQSPNISDHDFIEELERQLFALCTQVMALPMGRGMFTLRTSTPAATEFLAMPKLCLTGKDKLKGTTIELQQIEVPANMNNWPLFHNGVAAGLRISPEAEEIDSTWIVYNKPKSANDSLTLIEHSGFLMALGLNGHLKTLNYMSIYEYLVKGDEMTNIGLLLGISATHRGTMDVTTTKLLSVHIEALLPATALELDIPQNVQIAALMGIGLVYQRTAKRHIAEILLQEIGRPPGPEMENSIERESYSLAAGLALGLVTLGLGDSSPNLRDLKLPDALNYYMVGGNKRPLMGAQKEKYKMPSFHIREGSTVNIDVTAPGAIMALGLMFFRTENQAIADWMNPPVTKYLLDFIRPDMLMLRTIARGLICWKSIEPSYTWIVDHFPKSLEFDLAHGPSDPEADHEAYCQAYCNIVTGAAFCVGLRYAGVADQKAFESLQKLMDLFLNMSSMYIGEYAGKSTIESCMIVILLSMAIVNAGTGNLEVLRLIRMMRSRVGATYSVVTYGSQMSIHMALGFLFLGAGRYTLSQSPEAIAALVCSLFPKFPHSSTDNRYHLQAFRHLYVLAVEPRLLLPRDIESNKLSLCELSYVKIGSVEIIRLPTAPCILPPLDTIKRIIIDDPYHWQICFDRDRNWQQLIDILSRSECIMIKRKSGCKTHLEDPVRIKNFFAKTLTREQFASWKIRNDNLIAFSNDQVVQNFKAKFLDDNIEHSKVHSLFEKRFVHLLYIQYYKCLAKDEAHVLINLIELLTSANDLEHLKNIRNVWQFKIIASFTKTRVSEQLLSGELINSIISNINTLLDQWFTNNLVAVQQYLFASNLKILKSYSIESLQKIIAIVNYYDLPMNELSMVACNEITNPLQFIMTMKSRNLSASAIHYMLRIINF